MKFMQTVKGKTLVAGAALSTMFVAGSAFAQTAGDSSDLGAIVTGELATGKAQVLAVGGAILLIVAVVALIRHIRAAAR